MDISLVENLTDDELDKIKRQIGKAFVTNELFHNWGSYEQRADTVMTYISNYVDCVYKSKALYSNKERTGFIGLQNSQNALIMPQLKMLFRMLCKIKFSKLRSLMSFINQIKSGNEKYSKSHHLEILMVCVDESHQGKGIATELVAFAKKQSDELGLPLLFDTDMEAYAEMYQHLGCELYNEKTADNGVTRYNLVYNGDK